MTANLIIAIAGDSITGCAGRWPFPALTVTSTGDCTSPAAQTAASYASGRLLMRNMAISGSHLAGDPANNPVSFIRPTYIDPLYAIKMFARSGPTPRKYLYINAIGSNDGAIAAYPSVALYAAAVAADIVAAKAAGADFGWICGLLPRADAGAALTEANRLAYNALVTDPSWRAANGVDDCIDLSSAAHAGPLNLPANNGGDTTWYMADNIHPQNVLSAEIGVIALAKFNALLATI